MGWTKRAFVPPVKRRLAKVAGSEQQELIWERLRKTKKHIQVAALAGTGKTFTVCQGLLRLGESYGRMAFVAFNKAIAKKLEQKVPDWVMSSTLHSMLFGSVRNHYDDVQLEVYKTLNILEHLLGEYEYRRTEVLFRNGVEKLVSLCKNTLSDTDTASLLRLVDVYDVDLAGKEDLVFELVPEIMELSQDGWIEATGGVDFDDMIWLPVVKNLRLPTYDLLAVDECQDLNVCQQEAIKRIGKRLLLVGDENQAIYGFRGADTDAMERMADWMRATKRGLEVLPLTMTRRCPKSHVAHAQKIVSTFEAMPDAPQGSLEEKAYEQALAGMQPGDLVVCRLNAPAVAAAFGLLKRGTPANIQGRDLGRNLSGIVNKMRVPTGPGTVVILLVKLDAYYLSEKNKLAAQKRKRKTKLQNLEDKVDCLKALCSDADDVQEVLDRIDGLFKDTKADGRFVLLSSVHRAKGLEADTVWILYPELMPFPKAQLPWQKKQEWNLKYVAETRSKDRMVFVPMPKGEPD